MTKIPSRALIALFALACSPAMALDRAFVSAHGADNNGCGGERSPCRTLQYAHDLVASGGEIDILSPGSYGRLAITKGISIVNDGVGVASVRPATAGQDALTIGAGPADVVHIRGLDIDGRGIGGNGVVFTSGRALELVKSAVRHFAGAGVVIAPTGASSFAVLDTLIVNNASHGLWFKNPLAPTRPISVTGAINGVKSIDNDGVGILIDGGYVEQSTISITKSMAADNKQDGLRAVNTLPTYLTLVADDLTATGNQNVGLDVLADRGQGGLLLNRSFVSGNHYGAACVASVIRSHGNNSISANTAGDVQGSGCLAVEALK